MLGSGWVPGTFVQGSPCSGSGSRWWCEHRPELRLDDHFDDGHIGVGAIYILLRCSILISDHLRPKQFHLFASTEVHPNCFANKILRFPKAEGARLPAWELGSPPWHVVH